MGKFSRALDRAAQAEDKQRPAGAQADREAQSFLRNDKAAARQNEKSPPRSRKRSAPVAVSGRWDERVSRAVAESGPASESIRALRTRILHPPDGRIPKSILVTSATPGEGKSFICSALGIMLAQGVDHYALMVDCDLRRPALHRIFGLEAELGLVNFLRDRNPLAELIVPTGVNTLSLLPAGPPPVNPAELLGSESMIRLVDELEGRYDDRVILLDSPPLHSASETAILARRVDQVILVVRWAGSRREHVQRVVDEIGAEKIAGVVFNAYQATILDTRVFGEYEYGYYDQDR